MRDLVSDLTPYLRECQRVTISHRERRKAVTALISGLLALPLMWLLGGKIEPTAQGTCMSAVWFTTSATIDTLVVAPFFLWRNLRSKNRPKVKIIGPKHPHSPKVRNWGVAANDQN